MLPRRTTIALITALAIAAIAAGIWHAGRQTEAGEVIEVDRNDDVIVSTCNSAIDNDCSLRGAVSLANLVPGLDTIHIPADTYALTIAGAGNDNNATGDLDITDAVSISGDGENNTFIEAGASAATAIDRVLHIVSPGGSAGISALTVRNGKADGGGAILDEGHLEMADVAVRNSSDTGLGPSSGGGGIRMSGDATAVLLEVTIADNDAAAFGGGLLKIDGTGSWSITDSVVTGNNAGSSGGGLFLGLSTSASMTDVQVTDNEALTGEGGGIWIGADVISILRGSVIGNSAGSHGGGIHAPSDVSIDGTVISGNSVTNGQGGGIYGGATIRNALISGNSAAQGGGVFGLNTSLTDTAVTTNDALVGGGLFIEGGLSASGVTISGNNATQAGGGLYLENANPVDLTNTTISGNDAIVQGGGIWRDEIENDRVAGSGGGVPLPTGPVNLLNVSIADNTSDVGSAIFDANDDTNFEIMSTIVSGNTGGPTCSGELESLGYNIDDGTSCGFTFIGDQENTNPLLMDLANYGGQTDTHALFALSPAINAANPACPPPETDQRGVDRPINGRCDVGAFETDEPGPPTPTPSPTPDVTETPGATTAAPSATPTPIPTATPTPGPTDTPGPGRELEWGDNQCDNDLDPVDALGTLRFVASLSPVEQEEPCAAIGDDVDVVEASIHRWGDTDCDDDVDTVDALAILRVVAGLTPLLQTEPCPDIGDEVVVTQLP